MRYAEASSGWVGAGDAVITERHLRAHDPLLALFWDKILMRWVLGRRIRRLGKFDPALLIHHRGYFYFPIIWQDENNEYLCPDSRLEEWLRRNDLWGHLTKHQRQKDREEHDRIRASEERAQRERTKDISHDVWPDVKDELQSIGTGDITKEEVVAAEKQMEEEYYRVAED